MQAELKNYICNDIFDLENYKPLEYNNFCFLLQIFVGPKGTEGEESFNIEVCTPRWLEKNFNEDDIIIGYHYLIVQKYDFKNIILKIEKFIARCNGNTWNEIAHKIARLGLWEFEDYNELT